MAAPSLIVPPSIAPAPPPPPVAPLVAPSPQPPQPPQSPQSPQPRQAAEPPQPAPAAAFTGRPEAPTPDPNAAYASLTLPSLPPTTNPTPAPAAGPGVVRQLPQSTLDAMRLAGTETQRFKGQPRRRGFFHRWLRMRALGTAILLLIGGGGALVDRFTDQSAQPESPSEWDPRVLGFVGVVERERGLEFEHPVHVEFLSEAEFIAIFDPGESVLDDESKAYYDQQAALYNATGLAVDYDAAAGASTFGAVSTLGFYSPEVDQIVIRGSVLTPAINAVIVHELTHALQNQHFDLTLGGPDDFRQRAIVEADASRVENQYLISLDPDARLSADADNSFTSADEAALSKVPEALVDKQFAPYVLGPLVVEAAFARDGNAGVDELLINPPTEQVLINPWTYGLVDNTPPPPTPQPTVPADATIIEAPRAASLIDLLAMLDAWLPWTQARGALEGWNGGGYASYDTAAGSTCASFNISLTGPTDPFVIAIQSWSAASGSIATPTILGNEVHFEACTRGPAATPPPPAVVSMTEAIYLEHLAIQNIESAITPETVAPWQCLTRTLIDDAAAAPLLFLPTLDPDQEATFNVGYQAAAMVCGVSL